MEITKDILYVGVNDHLVDLFEGQYDVPNGMAYNSYLICDDKVAVMDSVDAHFTDEWITKIAAALGERTPDYLVVQHMEPDHSGSVAAFAQAYPGTTIVASAQAFNMMKAYFGTDYADRRVVVKEGDTLPLGTHTLHFVTAPMVHWPEVMVAYEETEKILFSADAFGRFGSLGRTTNAPWAPQARRCPSAGTGSPRRCSRAQDDSGGWPVRHRPGPCPSCPPPCCPRWSPGLRSRIPCRRQGVPAPAPASAALPQSRKQPACRARSDQSVPAQDPS